jgi:DNA-binding CsgD family transcriptional regulator
MAAPTDGRGGIPSSGGTSDLKPKRYSDKRVFLLYVAFCIQLLSALFFLGDLWSEVLNLRSRSIPWVWQEYIQALASIGLVTGLLVSGAFLRSSLGRLKRMGRQIDIASGNFEAHLMEMFGRWNLSPSEQGVAILAIKGFSNLEISNLRGTTPATIKSQMNSVFRKAGLANRQQLIAFLVEDLLAGVSLEPPHRDGGGKPAERSSLALDGAHAESSALN